MLAHVQSYVLDGIDALPCEVEVDVSERGLPGTTIVGLPDAAVKESLERVRAAVSNTGYEFPVGRILVNLAPADVRKEGPVYDLPIALGLLRATGVIRDGQRLDRILVAGELALDGRVRPVSGIINMAILAERRGAKAALVPEANAAEAAVVGGLRVYPIRTLADAVGLLNKETDPTPHEHVDVETLIAAARPDIDFGDIVGQEAAKRAVTIAAAGSHNLLRMCPSVGRGRNAVKADTPPLLGALWIWRSAKGRTLVRIHVHRGGIDRLRAPALKTGDRTTQTTRPPGVTDARQTTLAEYTARSSWTGHSRTCRSCGYQRNPAPTFVQAGTYAGIVQHRQRPVIPE